MQKRRNNSLPWAEVKLREVKGMEEYTLRHTYIPAKCSSHSYVRHDLKLVVFLEIINCLREHHDEVHTLYIHSGYNKELVLVFLPALS